MIFKINLLLKNRTPQKLGNYNKMNYLFYENASFKFEEEHRNLYIYVGKRCKQRYSVQWKVWIKNV